MLKDFDYSSLVVHFWQTFSEKWRFKKFKEMVKTEYMNDLFDAQNKPIADKLILENTQKLEDLKKSEISFLTSKLQLKYKRYIDFCLMVYKNTNTLINSYAFRDLSIVDQDNDHENEIFKKDLEWFGRIFEERSIDYVKSKTDHFITNKELEELKLELTKPHSIE
ncbi:hypothetical protein HAU30_09075 [Weissella confusa]|uniref:hypothetical protein n=1 Tax=Weissella confusa TaxID=1583 RepID=UPI0018F2321D|nr:hypothetical protein [Weissella confusa]MBJ7680610.1 hypothetical protein [Weissella confusa]